MWIVDAVDDDDDLMELVVVVVVVLGVPSRTRIQIKLNVTNSTMTPNKLTTETDDQIRGPASERGNP